MKREKQLIKNTIIIAIGQFCTKFISFFLLPLYTSLLTAKEYGIVDLLNTFICLLLPIFFMQIDQAVFRYLIDYRNDEKKISECISSTIYFTFIQSIFFIIGFCIISFFYKNEYMFFLVINLLFSMFATVLLQISRGIGETVLYSIGSLISGVSTIVLNVVFVLLFKLGAYGIFSATAIGNLLCILFMIFSLKMLKFIKIENFNKKELKKLLIYSLPLVPNQLSWWIVNVSDRIIISYFINVAANGVYSAANKFSAICITVFNIFNLTWSESASLSINDNDSSDFFTNVFNTFYKLFSCICLGIIVCMPLFFKFLIVGNDFADAYYHIPILMISTFFNILVSLLGSVYVALKKSGEIAKTSIIAAIINLLINLIFIRFIGLYAASVSTLIAYLVMFVYRYLDVQKYVRIKIDFKYSILFLFISIVSLPSYYINELYLNIIIFSIVLIFSTVINFKSILILLRKRKK